MLIDYWADETAWGVDVFGTIECERCHDPRGCSSSITPETVTATLAHYCYGCDHTTAHEVSVARALEIGATREREVCVIVEGSR